MRWLARRRSSRNLLDLVPERRVPHELDPATGKVTLVVPRFQSPLGKRLFSRLTRSPDFHVRLDELGSFVWLQMDGALDLARIAAAAREHLGERVEPAAERVALFAHKLERDGFVRLTEPLPAAKG
jgi:hypothetical protein